MEEVKNDVKKKNWFVRLWNYYTTYEKIWLISICSLGILFAVLFPESDTLPTWLRIVEIIAIIGGCSCELLLSKQSKWAFIVSFVLYDTTQTIVYFANGLYVSAIFEIVFWMPMLFISFYFWDKKADKKNRLLTAVKEVNFKRDLAIFIVVLVISVGVGYLFTQIDVIANGLSEYWYLDALANTFSVCNGLFLLMRFKEQWIPWLGVAIIEAILWILSGQYIMLILSLGYIMNSIYGFIKWTKYIKVNPNTQNETFFGKPILNEKNTGAEENEQVAMEQKESPDKNLSLEGDKSNTVITEEEKQLDDLEPILDANNKK